MLKISWLFPLLLLACASPEDVEIEDSSSSQSSVATIDHAPTVAKVTAIELPEPVIKGLEGEVRLQFSKLDQTEDKFLKIQDTIEFPGLAKQMLTDQTLKDVQLNVVSHCTALPNRVIVKQFNRPLSVSIPLIELLSEEVLFADQGDFSLPPPSCEFSFKAVHKDGAAHYFEFPALPIVNYTQNNSIHFFDPPEIKETKENFYHIFVSDLSQYNMNITKAETMNRLELKCETFSRHITLHSQQFVPFASFNIEQEKEASDPLSQNCRVFAYKNDILLGTSSLLRLFYPTKQVAHLKIESEFFEERAEDFYSLFVRADGDRINHNLINVSLYSYSIRNTNSKHPIHVLIVNPKNLELPFKGVYSANRKAFYRPVKYDVKFGDIKVVRGDFSQKQIEEGRLITLSPGSKVELPVILDGNFQPCRPNSRRKDLQWWGGVVQYPDIKLYHLASDRVDLIPLEQNILGTLNNREGKGFSFFSKHLMYSLQKEENGLAFKRASCSGEINPQKTYPSMALYPKGDNTAKVRWSDRSVYSSWHYHTDHVLLQLWERYHKPKTTTSVQVPTRTVGYNNRRQAIP